MLSLLGLQTQGAFPQHLAYDWLLPTLDLTRWYLEAEQDYPTLTAAVTTQGFTSFLTVPLEETWILLGGCVAPPVGGITNGRIITPVKTNSQGGGVMALGPEQTHIATSFRLTPFNDSVAGFLCRPGSQLGIWQTAATAADNLVFVARVVKLQRS
jgi:hypothetical protein